MASGVGPEHKVESETKGAEKTHKMAPETKNLGEGNTRSMRFQKSFCSFLSFFLDHTVQHVGCGILAPQPGTKPTPRALEARSLNHWNTKEVLVILFFSSFSVVSANLETVSCKQVILEFCVYLEASRYQ